jgi:PAS domain S-box-containing protein
VASSPTAARFLARATGKMRDYPLWAQYAVSLGAVGAALLARDLLSPWLGEQFPFVTVFLTLFPLVLLVRPGPFLAASLVGWVGVVLLFMHPSLPSHWDRTAVLQVVFFMAGVLVAAFTSWLAQRRLTRERQKDAILRAFVDESPTSKWVTDADGRVVYANEAMARTLGAPVEAMLGRIHTDLLPYPARKAAQDNLLAVRDTGAPQLSLEETGSATLEWRRFPLSFDEGGKVAFVAAMANDITDELRQERTLRESEARLVATIESIGDGFCTLDANGRYLYMNEAGARLLNGKPADFIGRRWVDLFPEAVGSDVDRAIQRALGDRVSVELETWYEPWDRWFYLKISPVEDGGYSFYFGDITESRRAATLLRAKEKELERIIELTPFLMNRCSRDLRFRFVSPAYAGMIGRSPAELVGEPIVDVMGQEGFRTILPYIERVLAGETVRYEAAVPFAGVGTRDLSVVYTPDQDAQGEVIGWVASIVDQTTTKRMDRQLAERAVELATALEAEREARREAEEATRVKDEFLATLSHELRTPLSAILGWIHLIERNPGETTLVEEAIPVIARNARAQMSLISDLLDTSRILSGKIHLELERLDLGQLVRAAIEAARGAADTKGVRLETDFGPAALAVQGDASRLQQVVWNLLSNAVKFTNGGTVIHVSLSQQGPLARIVVRDSGQGISPEFLPYVFERFRQADSSMARRFVGLGLGLAIVKQLVELHGGSVSVQSAGEGHGATFAVELPLSIEPQLQTVANTGPAGPSAADLRGVKILAVEDQPDSLELLKRLLQEHHAQVATARTVDEGLASLRSERPDIVLCDLGLPGKDGFEFMRVLRDSGDPTPVVALTAFARDEDRLRALRAGFRMHVTKPFDAAGLVSIVAGIVAQGSKA